uniref:Transmembrane protein n=1 Tax=Heterorhabditis bacteriophora TaxID=37862 RepID=A0A1I7WJ56_HETBA
MILKLLLIKISKIIVSVPIIHTIIKTHQVHMSGKYSLFLVSRPLFFNYLSFKKKLTHTKFLIFKQLFLISLLILYHSSHFYEPFSDAISNHNELSSNRRCLDISLFCNTLLHLRIRDYKGCIDAIIRQTSSSGLSSKFAHTILLGNLSKISRLICLQCVSIKSILFQLKEKKSTFDTEKIKQLNHFSIYYFKIVQTFRTRRIKRISNSYGYFIVLHHTRYF